ncbi:adenylate/guanylate cyclase domain-containing protein [Caldimonas tepidiphila]|uniref:adenylate/guanylate cyclase domain-containing protein n=1 Tax=Caldimonas tepidiphila TaxID=2315841 RepID=UPI0013005618|nr:adenylate/guanylate cyclase domain-containing protein [Caldimonas tepidiphila]
MKPPLLPPPRSLSRTLPLVALLFTVVPLLIAGVLTLTGVAQRLRVEQERRLSHTATLLAERVEHALAGTERLARLVAGDATTRAALQPAASGTDAAPVLADELRRIERARPEVDRIEVLDPAGRPLVRTTAAARFVRLSPETGPHWRPRLAAPGLDRFEPVLEEGRTIGWVRLGMAPRALGELLTLNRDAEGTRIRALLLPRAGTAEAMPIAASEGLGAEDLAALARPAEAVLSARAPVEATGWTVVVSEPPDAYRALVRQEALRFGLIGLVVSVCSAWLAWGFARGLAQEIREVARSARAILRGHYLNAHVESRRDDELGLLARSFNHMSMELEKRERERDVFGRLVSPEVRDQLMHGELMLGGHEVEVTVLLCDIRGFTALCESLAPRDIVLMLNEYFTRMTEAVRRHEGYINNFIGDAMVVVFGAPRPDPHRVERALYAAVAMQQALDEFNAERAAYGAPLLRIGIGLASGTALAGQIGSPERCIYTVIGDTVNIAARLEGLDKEHPGMAALVNAETHDLLPLALRRHLVALGEQQLRGRDQTVAVYALPRDAALPPPPPELMRPEEVID